MARRARTASCSTWVAFATEGGSALGGAARPATANVAVPTTATTSATADTRPKILRGGAAATIAGAVTSGSPRRMPTTPAWNARIFLKTLLYPGSSDSPSSNHDRRPESLHHDPAEIGPQAEMRTGNGNIAEDQVRGDRASLALGRTASGRSSPVCSVSTNSHLHCTPIPR